MLQGSTVFIAYRKLVKNDSSVAINDGNNNKINNNCDNNDNLYSAVTLPKPKAKALYMILVPKRLIEQKLKMLTDGYC